jgi:hypothetical protein
MKPKNREWRVVDVARFGIFAIFPNEELARNFFNRGGSVNSPFHQPQLQSRIIGGSRDDWEVETP